MKYAMCDQCSFYEAKQCIHDPNPDAKMLVLLPNPVIDYDGKDAQFKHVQGLLEQLLKQPRYQDISMDDIDYAYLLECLGNHPINERNVRLCSQGLYTKLLTSNSPILFALGDMAVKAIQLQGNINDLRQTHIPVTLLDKSFKAAISWHLAETPSVQHTLDDLKFALNLVHTKIPIDHWLNQQGRLAKPDKVKNICAKLLERKPPLLSVRLSVSTYKSYLDHAKVLGISFGWDLNRTVSFFLDHEKSEYSAEDIIPHIKPLLESDIPKAVHNTKQVQNMLRKYGLKLHNIVHDTCYVEHILNEARPGYELVDLMRTYTPEFIRYHQHIQQLKEDIKQIQIEMLLDNEVPMPFSKKIRSLVEAHYVPGRNLLEIKAFCEALIAEKGELVHPDIKKLLRSVKPSITSWRKKRESPTIKALIATEKALDKFATDEYLDPGTMLRYLGLQAEAMWIISQDQMELLQRAQSEKLSNMLPTIYLPAADTYGQTERLGLEVDTEYLDTVHQLAQDQIEKLSERIYEAAEFRCNLRSHDTVAQLLKDRLCVPLQQQTQAGHYDLKKDTLQAFMQDKNLMPEARVVLDSLIHLRTVEHIFSYAENAKWFVKNAGRIYFTNNLFGAPTGRISTVNMNLQGMPSTPYHDIDCPHHQELSCKCTPLNIKKIILPDSDKHVIVSFDVAGAEIRIFAAYSRDDNLITILNEGRDIHSWLTAKRTSLPYQDKQSGMTDEFKLQRRKTKIVFFGSLYGITAYGLSRDLNISQAAAQALIDEVFELIPSLPQYIERCKKSLHRKGYIETFMGRRRRYNTSSIQKGEWGRVYRQLINFPIQATAHDILMIQLPDLQKQFDAFQGRFMLEVHDDSAFSVPRNRLLDAQQSIKYTLTEQVAQKFKWLPVPFELEINAGLNYGEMQPIETFLN